MYSDTEIETAVTSGAIDRSTADRLRTSIAQQRSSSPADDEQFRLVTGFNDIFVTIAAALVLFATGVIFGGLGVAAVSWGLAEYFTRKKHMALPSIFLLLCFSGGLFAFLAMIVGHLSDDRTHVLQPFRHNAFGSEPFNPTFLIGMAAAGCLTAAGVAAHWRRFHVPITIAAGATALCVVATSLLMLVLYAAGVESVLAFKILPWFAFATGLVMFAFAMRWDLTDPERTTRRSDVAFWLHLTASPLIVHPLFLEIAHMGARGTGAEVVGALLAILLYVVLGIVALVADRRAVLVSALAYVVAAIGVLMRTNGAVATNIAVSGAIIGGLLLAMSVFWRDLRGAIVKHLPERFRIRLPAAK